MSAGSNLNLMDIIGPVMIGPSSSHTAGACRIGYIARKILASEPVKAHIKLCGSFASTYKGHGTDRALVAGIMGMRPDDERLPDSLNLASAQGLIVTFETIHNSRSHPNTAIIDLVDAQGNSVEVEGASVGGGNILITRLNGMESVFDGHCDTLIIPHKDTQGVIANITQALALYGVNIGNFRLTRPQKNDVAIMTIEVDGAIDDGVVDLLRRQPNILHVTCLQCSTNFK